MLELFKVVLMPSWLSPFLMPTPLNRGEYPDLHPLRERALTFPGIQKCPDDDCSSPFIRSIVWHLFSILLLCLSLKSCPLVICIQLKIQRVLDLVYYLLSSGDSQSSHLIINSTRQLYRDGTIIMDGRKQLIRLLILIPLFSMPSLAILLT